MKSFEVLGTRVDSGINPGNFREVFFRLLNKGNSKIFTVNPEFIVDSFFDISFQKVLNKSDYNSVDGFGLAWWLRVLEKKKISPNLISRDVFTGVEITDQILKICNNEGFSIFLLGGSSSNQTSRLVSEYIFKKYPKIKIVGYSSDFSFKESDDRLTIKFIKQKMKESSVNQIDVLFVAYGHKKQEFWLDRNQSKIPARLGIGVGGTFDYLSGNLKRAPKFLRSSGLEWLYRLIIQPQRIFRIIKAVIMFPILVAFDRNSATKH